MTPGPGIEPGPQRWEASALATAPSLHPPIGVQSPIYEGLIRFMMFIKGTKKGNTIYPKNSLSRLGDGKRNILAILLSL